MIAEKTSPQGGEQVAATRCPAIIEYELMGDLRYLSHHDELRLLTRALARSGWPVAFSRGFNPQPRMRVPLPRAVGVDCRPQVAVVDLNPGQSPRELFDRLEAVLPAGCRLRRVVFPSPTSMPHATRVVYEVELEPGDRERIRGGLPRLAGDGPLRVARRAHPDEAAREIDIRPFVDRVEVCESILRMELQVRQQQTARPAEILTVLGLAADARPLRVSRIEVQWDNELDGPWAGPRRHKRNDIGEQDESNEQEQAYK